MYLLIFIIALLLLYLANFYLNEPRHYPPGPFAWPLIGNYFDYKSFFYVYLTDVGKTYGPITSIRHGTCDIVVLNDLDLIRRAYAMPTFCARPHWMSSEDDRPPDGTFTFKSISPDWKFLRKSSVRALTMLKLSGSEHAERRCRLALDRMIHDLTAGSIENDADWSPPIDPARGDFRCLLTIMGLSCVEREFDPDDPRLLARLQVSHDTSILTRIGSAVDAFPFLKLYYWKSMRHLHQYGSMLREYMREKLDKDAASRLKKRTSDGVFDLSDAFDQLMNAESEDSGTNRYTEKERTLIRHSITDLFDGGLFATFAALKWSLLYLAKHKKIVDEMRGEILAVCGQDRAVKLDDKPRLVFIDAVINEILRMANVAPLGLPHCTTESTRIGEYIIPANTPVLCNLWAVHHDPIVFPNPFAFDPHRFLIRSGDGPDATWVLNQGLVTKALPFVTGLRRCPGEHFARQHLFLILANLVRRLEFRLASKYDDLNDAEEALTRRALPYKLSVREIRK